MELHKAIIEIVASKGAEMIGNIQIINYLLDYQAFKEKPATKLILRAIIDSGYAENILALINTTGWDLPASIFNIPLCLLPEEYHQYAAQSISDWKTKFLDLCEECAMKEKCCGLFATSQSTFKGLKPLYTSI